MPWKGCRPVLFFRKLGKSTGGGGNEKNKKKRQKWPGTSKYLDCTSCGIMPNATTEVLAKPSKSPRGRESPVAVSETGALCICPSLALYF